MSTVIGERAAGLATAFERAIQDLILTLERCSEADLRTPTGNEGWPVVVVAHHVAVACPAIGGMVQLMATGQIVPPLSMSDLDALNAQHAKEAANASRKETVQLLQTNGQATADMIRRFTDTQLDTAAVLSFSGGQPWTAADLIERALIGHPREHEGSIRASLGWA